MDRLINKLTSGRFILTVLVGVAFCKVVWEKAIPVEAATAIITMVFVSYFERKDRGGQNGN